MTSAGQSPYRDKAGVGLERNLPGDHAREGVCFEPLRGHSLYRRCDPEDIRLLKCRLRETYERLGTDLVVYGHIHRPFVREVGEITVINSGSAGLSYDADWRAAYLVIDDGKPSIRRVEYDLEKEVDDLLGSNYPYAAWLAEIRKTGTYIPPPTLI